MRRLAREIQSRARCPTRCRSVRSGSVTSSRGMCRTTPSSSSIPAMPACGWAACMTLPRRGRAICAAPAISAGPFPAGLGAKCACPDRPVVTFTGDAGFWYHIAEIETAARWNINAVTVVNNNGGGNQSKRGFDRVYGGKQTEKARELWNFSKINFARHRRRHGRARHPRRSRLRHFPRRWRRRSRPNGPSSSTSSPISTRWRRPRLLDLARCRENPR